MSERFTEFDVSRVVVESEIITSFYLAPKTPLARDSVPGEYLLFEHAVAGADPVRREYSISGQDGDCLRVTIKREDAPDGILPAGVMSTRFHTSIKAGDTVRASGPMGKFTLDRTSSQPVVLLSGGVGITPMMAMAHELVETGTRDVAFIHACENGRVHAMGDEVRGLVADYANMLAHFLYRTPDPQDRAGVDYDTRGMIDQALLETLLPTGECDFYLCGPGPFMQAMYDMLHDMGVATDRIQYEFFGPASVLKPKGAVPKVANENPTGPQITFAKSGVTAGWDAESENLLEFAEDQGVMVDYSCRAGTCVTCKTKVLSGTVSYPTPPFEQPEDGFALLCCCLPDGDLELDV